MLGYLINTIVIWAIFTAGILIGNRHGYSKGELNGSRKGFKRGIDVSRQAVK